MPRQFQLRTLLIAVAVCAFGIWWVIRPRQTAQWYVTEGYKADNREVTLFRQTIERDPSKSVLSSVKRSWYDCLVGRQSFLLENGGRCFRFDVVRGQVTGGPRVHRIDGFMFDVF
jgi:hypothetical protein